MPDWVINELSVTGDKVAVEAFRQRAASTGKDGRDFAFHRLLPMPDTLAPTAQADWRKANWGVSSEAVETMTDWDGDAWVCTFETPWRPPMLFLQRMAQELPELTFKLDYRSENSDWIETAVFAAKHQGQ